MKYWVSDKCSIKMGTLEMRWLSNWSSATFDSSWLTAREQTNSLRTIQRKNGSMWWAEFLFSSFSILSFSLSFVCVWWLFPVISGGQFCCHRTVIIFLIWWSGGGCHNSPFPGRYSVLEIKNTDSRIRMPVLISYSATSWIWDFENSNTPLFSHL